MSSKTMQSFMKTVERFRCDLICNMHDFQWFADEHINLRVSVSLQNRNKSGLYGGP